TELIQRLAAILVRRPGTVGGEADDLILRGDSELGRVRVLFAAGARPSVAGFLAAICVEQLGPFVLIVEALTHRGCDRGGVDATSGLSWCHPFGGLLAEGDAAGNSSDRTVINLMI